MAKKLEPSHSASAAVHLLTDEGRSGDNGSMETITLGRTGFQVSRMGLGGGGHSRLGQETGRSENDSVLLVQRALDLGINFIDTAEGYRTESIIGSAIRDRKRDDIILCTKKTTASEQPITPAALRSGLEQSLSRLDTDYVDVYLLHALKRSEYDHAIHALLPEMLKLKDEGKLRAVGVSEAFNSDRGHEMLQRAMEDDCWDVVMVGFNILNQSARRRVLLPAREKNIGTLCMFAVRAALSRPEKLKQLVGELIQSGMLNSSVVDKADPLGFLMRDGAAESIVDAAYRFCRDEPGMHVILSGTGNLAHLEQNLASLRRPPLPAADRQRLIEMFGSLDTVTNE